MELLPLALFLSVAFQGSPLLSVAFQGFRIDMMTPGAAGLTCYSCSSLSGDQVTYASQWKSLFGLWPAQTLGCKAAPTTRVACMSYCVTQTFSIYPPMKPSGQLSGMIRGCADQVLAGGAQNPPQPSTCCNSHTGVWNGLVVQMNTCPCQGNMCNGGNMAASTRPCDNPCAHNTCPAGSGACQPMFDGVSYQCGNAPPTKSPPTTPAPRPGWTKAAQMFLNSIDFTMDPCQDFYQFTCGNWIKNHPIPPTRSSISNFGAIQANLLSTVGNGLLMPTNGTNAWPTAIKTAQTAFQACINFNSSMNSITRFKTIINQMGGWPILNESYSETTLTLWERSGSLAAQYGVSSFISPSVDTDWKNPTKNALYLGQSTLTYPTVYYTNPAMVTTLRNALSRAMTAVTYAIAQEMGLTLHSLAVQQDVNAMIDLEFSIASETVPPTKERQYMGLYNPFTLAQANQRWPNINWAYFLNTFLETTSWPVQKFIITEPTFFDAFNNQLGTIDSLNIQKVQRIFQNYLVWRLVYEKIQFIPIPKVREAYLELKKTMDFVEELPALQDQCTSFTLQSMPYAASRLYIDQHFNKLPNNPRGFIRKMTTSVLGAFRQMVANLQWMDTPTKIQAINKVNNLVQNYAYPDWMMDNTKLNTWYQSLLLQPTDDMWTVFQKITNFQQGQLLASLTATVDRTNFEGPPAIVNAWYQPERNSITFPAGILNPPFFEADFPEAVNYGAMGIVEGHELTHGFDDQGVQWTGNGTLNPWIDPSSLTGFKNMAQCVINEYSQFCYDNGQYCVNGVQTQGENIADNGGMKAAFLALKASEILNGQQPPLPGLEQYTNDQLFFIAFGQIWCENQKLAATEQQILLDPHSPARVRVIASIRNFPPFQTAFNCPANSPMSPTQHCTVW